MNKYLENKARIRQEAIEYQLSFDQNNYSYGELAIYEEYFYRMGKRYGLLREFRENGIV